jgi:16S rRNA (guanine527-N7)-methyltransferase
MQTRHLADCSAVVGPLRRAIAPVPPPVRILDVGSGGGLPGVVLALAEPSWQVTCIDAVGKKVAFVRQVAAELALSNLSAVQGRVEAMKAPLFQVVTARAFGSLAELVLSTRHLLAKGGVWMAMKGLHPDNEIAAVPTDVLVFHVEPLVVLGLAAQRCLVWMRQR